jgi:hypothetical protein
MQPLDGVIYRLPFRDKEKRGEPAEPVLNTPQKDLAMCNNHIANEKAWHYFSLLANLLAVKRKPERRKPLTPSQEPASK